MIKAGDVITLRTGIYSVINNNDGVIWYKCPSGVGQTIEEFITAINGTVVIKTEQPSYIDIINKM
jgi:hypothetical protein